MVRALLFCFRIGIDPGQIRIRQHMKDELAHYSSDCWDIEFNMSFDHQSDEWLEIIGISDRGTYDLTAHQRASNQALVARRYYDQPKEVEKIVPVVDQAYWGKTYRKDTKQLLQACIAYLMSTLPGSNEDEYWVYFDEPIVSQWDKDDQGQFKTYNSLKVCKQHLRLEKIVEMASYEEFVPSVIEPSFGLDRIMYAVFRSAFNIRNIDKINHTFPATKSLV